MIILHVCLINLMLTALCKSLELSGCSPSGDAPSSVSSPVYPRPLFNLAPFAETLLDYLTWSSGTSDNWCVFRIASPAFLVDVCMLV